MPNLIFVLPQYASERGQSFLQTIPVLILLLSSISTLLLFFCLKLVNPSFFNINPIYILCLSGSVCLSDRMYPINLKMAKPIGPKFCVGPHMTQGRVMDAQSYTNLCPKVFDFCSILKIRKKILLNLWTFFCYCFKVYKEKMIKDKATIKSWNRRKARSAQKSKC